MTKLMNEEGATLAEYGLLLALIAVACIAAIGALGNGIQGLFNALSSQFAGVVSGLP